MKIPRARMARGMPYRAYGRENYGHSMMRSFQCAMISPAKAGGERAGSRGDRRQALLPASPSAAIAPKNELSRMWKPIDLDVLKECAGGAWERKSYIEALPRLELSLLHAERIRQMVVQPEPFSKGRNQHVARAICRIRL